jgi:ATP phosphoribosyltransferase regulatory subunit
MPAAQPKTGDGGRLKEFFEAAGAAWLSLPVLQPADPFLEAAGEDIRRRMFVTEGVSGERLALRPDFTIPVCLHHLSEANGPRIYAYEGAVFRRAETGASELTETGYEDIGRTGRISADADALTLAVEAVNRLSGEKVAVRLGDIGLFTALLAALDLPQAWRRRLRLSFGLADRMRANLDRLAAPRTDDPMAGFDAELVKVAERHDEAVLTAFLERRAEEHGHVSDTGRTAADIARRFLDQLSLRETHLDQRTLDILRDYLSLEAPLGEAAERLGAFFAGHDLSLDAALGTFSERAGQILGRDALASHTTGIFFSAAFGRPLDYYTGLVFELALAGQARPVAGGGRYDGLMQMLGTDEQVPAIGFSVRLSDGGGQP